VSNSKRSKIQIFFQGYEHFLIAPTNFAKRLSYYIIKKENFMKRHIAVCIAFLLFFSLLQGTTEIRIAKAETQPIWPMQGYNSMHTGQCPYDTSKNNGTLKWKFKANDKIWSSLAIAEDGTTYAGSRDRYLYAINPDGTLKWKFETGGWIVSSPSIAKDGTIYVGSRDNYFYALDHNGTLKWKFETGDVIYSSPAIAGDGTIYLGANTNHLDIFKFLQSYLYALNPNGTLRWKFKAGRRIQTSPAISSDGTIYVGSNDRYLYAINPDGTLRWKYKTGGRIWSSPAISSDGTIYVGSNDRYLYAINPDGTLRWKYKTGHWIMSSSVSSPAIARDGTIYVGAWDGYMSAINPNGTLKWKFPNSSSKWKCEEGWLGARPIKNLMNKIPSWLTAGLDEITSSPVISSDGTIYIGSNDNYLYALNPDCTLKWKFKTGDGIFSSPAISRDGTIYVGSWDHYLYAIGDGTSLGASELTETGLRFENPNIVISSASKSIDNQGNKPMINGRELCFNKSSD
jgi:outer membrane protein assembly factor BamB